MALALLPGSAWAGRPLDTEDPGTIAAGNAELEASLDYAKNAAGRFLGLKGVIGVGLLSNLEVRFESTLLHADPVDADSRTGLGDSLFGAKYRLLDEREGLPAFMVAFTLRLPTGNRERGLGDQGVDAGLFAVVGKSIGPVTLNGNGGYVFVSRDRALDFGVLTGSLEYRLSPALSVLAEGVGTLGVDLAPNTGVLRFGVLYALSQRVKLDAAVGFGVTGASPDVTATLGTTITLF